MYSISRKFASKLSVKTKTWFNYFQRRSTIRMSEFAHRQLDLLEVEHLAEIEERNLEVANLSHKILQRKGLCIPKLVINSLETGLYERSIASFSLRTTEKVFPFNILSTGDIVKIDYTKQEKDDDVDEECNGIVIRITDKQISVAFDSITYRDTLDNLNQHGNSVALIKVANKVTYERLKRAMQDLNRYSNGPSQHLIDVLFGNATPTSNLHDTDICLHNKHLNQCQRSAVEFALNQRELAIIHGPPGTGKTTTMIEIILQIVQSGQKVLACAPSNVAVDNLLEKLSEAEISLIRHGFKTHHHTRKLKLARLGHPARILDPKLQELSLDALISRSGASSIIRDVRSDLDDIQAKLRRCHDKSRRGILRQDRKKLMSELKTREKKATRDVLHPVDVVLATNVGAYSQGPLHVLKVDHFDVIIIDECGQALEASCWIPLMKARKCIIAGDHLQLSPTILSQLAADEGLALTLLERLIKLHGDKVVCMLTEQYRMHHVIMDWASQQMYDGKLSAHASVQSHLLSDIAGVEKTDDTSIPLLLIDTCGCDMLESESEESDSKANEGEARIVVHQVTSLVDAGVDPSDIAVVSPYNLQVDILRHFLHKKFPKLEIKSVDGFQGREKEAVILSLVRSNATREVGFLSDNRRLNVAVTRARRHLTVICDSSTVSNHTFIKSLLDHINDNGEARSGFEYSHLLEEFDYFQPFHLTTSNQTKKITEPGHSGKKIESSKRSSVRKSGKVSKTSAENNSSTNGNRELKQMYCDIIMKYYKRFSPDSVETVNLRAEFDFSDAINIKVVEKTKEIIFPTTLTSSERRVIHEICNELSISHHSSGQEPKRQIIVKFPDIEEVCVESDRQLPQEPAINEEDSPEDQDVSPDGDATRVEESNILPEISTEDEPLDHEMFVQCEKCMKTFPRDNILLHGMHCERVSRIKNKLAEEASIRQSTDSTKIHKTNSTKKKKSTTRKQNIENEDDFDSLINEAMSSNRTCYHEACTACVSTTGQQCTLCRRIFCLAHTLPEVHGCGGRARIHARRQICRDGVLYGGGGVPDRKPSNVKQSMVRKKLSNKLKEMEESRKYSKGRKNKN